MNAISLQRPLEGEPLLRSITHRTGSRFASLLISCGLVTVETARFDERISGGFFESEDAGVVGIATRRTRYDRGYSQPRSPAPGERGSPAISEG